MHADEDRNLRLLEHELNFIARHAQTIGGAGLSDFEAVDEINMAVESALRALHEYELGLRPADEEFPSEIAMPEAA